MTTNLMTRAHLCQDIICPTCQQNLRRKGLEPETEEPFGVPRNRICENQLHSSLCLCRLSFKICFSMSHDGMQTNLVQFRFQILERESGKPSFYHLMTPGPVSLTRDKVMCINKYCLNLALV